MPWFKVDDNLAFHQKVLRAGNAAMGLWVRAGSWCAQQLTDGFVPADIAQTLGSRTEATRLVTANLWLERDDGYEFWQWGEEGRQPTRAEVEEKRKQSRERQRRAREKAEQSRRDKQRDSARDTTRTDAVSHDSPDPTRPDPSLKNPEDSLETRKRAHRLPDDWKPTEADVTWQREQGIDDLFARREFEKFTDHWRAEGSRTAAKLDWSAAWRNWLRKAREWQRPTPGATPTGTDVPDWMRGGQA